MGAPARDGVSHIVGASKSQPGRLPRSLSGIAAEAGSAVLASALREAGPMLQRPAASDLVQHGSGPLDILAAAHQRLSQPSPFAQAATSYFRRQGAPEAGTGALQAGSNEVDLTDLRVSWAAGVDGGRQRSGGPPPAIWQRAPCRLGPELDFTKPWMDWAALHRGRRDMQFARSQLVSLSCG